MYKYNNVGLILREADGATIPLDPDNLDYQECMQWVEGGGEIAPADVVPVEVPANVSMRQARLALLTAGKLAAVDTAIDSLPSPTKEQARIEWDYSSQVHRQRSLVAQMGPLLGLTEEEIDNLFILAATL